MDQTEYIRCYDKPDFIKQGQRMQIIRGNKVVTAKVISVKGLFADVTCNGKKYLVDYTGKVIQ
jgi:hypothetical protein